MKNKPKHLIYNFSYRNKKWYAHNVFLGNIGGLKLKRELVEYMEEYWNADIIGDSIYIPMKMFN